MAAETEETIVVENDLYRVELSNRGAVVRSWQLKKYKDSRKPAGILDVVHTESSAQLAVWPLSLVTVDLPYDKTANAALFRVTSPGKSIRAPAVVTFEWSDGHLSVTRSLRFDHSYVVGIDSSVSFDGQPVAHGVAWRGGFGDSSIYNPAEQVSVFYREQGSLHALPYQKLGHPDKQHEVFRHTGTQDYAGIQDRYFAAAFVPRGPGMSLWHWKLERGVPSVGKETKVPVPEMGAGSTLAGPIAFRIFVGPKDLDVLGQLNPPMKELVDFGWLRLFATPLFALLKWIHNLSWVQNYGWAIVLMTVVLNLAMYPLKVKSYRSSQRMQKLNPEIQAIRARYAKYPARDPRKQQESQEVWALYKKQGVNPAGACLPMLVQLPIWIALYSMLGVAIELRQAPWMLWIRDLSERDPWYILPVLMGVTMYVMQKMTPVTVTDPAQQMMMNLMPIMFGGMFLVVPISSGLVLYILTSNVVGIAQQWHLNRTAPAAPADKEKGKKARKT